MSQPQDPEKSLELMFNIPDPLAHRSEHAPPAALRAHSPTPVPPQGAHRTRGQTRRLRALALAFAPVWLAVNIGLTHTRDDLGELPAAFVVAQFVLPLGLAALALWAALAPGKRGLGLSAPLLRFAIACCLLGFLTTAWLGPLLHTHSDEPSESALKCWLIASAWGTLPLLAGAFAFARAFPAAARERAALLGGAAGALSGAAIHLVCPVNDTTHLLVGHFSAVLTAVAVAAWGVARAVRA